MSDGEKYKLEPVQEALLASMLVRHRCESKGVAIGKEGARVYPPPYTYIIYTNIYIIHLNNE